MPKLNQKIDWINLNSYENTYSSAVRHKYFMVIVILVVNQPEIFIDYQLIYHAHYKVYVIIITLNYLYRHRTVPCQSCENSALHTYRSHSRGGGILFLPDLISAQTKQLNSTLLRYLF